MLLKPSQDSQVRTSNKGRKEVEDSIVFVCLFVGGSIEAGESKKKICF
jgi:hypothetical protein